MFKLSRLNWPLDKVISLILLVVIFALIPVLALVRPNPGLGVQRAPKIKSLIYPTLGNPAIVPVGGRLTVEFDPREQNWVRPVVELSDFKVTVKSTNDPYPVVKTLPVVSAKMGRSSRWPEYGGIESGVDRSLYLVTVTIPPGVPCDLYDMTVESKGTGDTPLKDTQPHAFQAIDAYKDRFNICQVTDIHVWGPEIYYPSCTYQERSRRPDGKDPRRKGAVYYQKAIDQINLMKPDFCVFSGDYMFGQSYFEQDNGPPWGTTTEYQYEMLWFYRETLKLDVPVFMTIGNHDGYNEDDEGAGEDWFVNWRKLFGPLYHSFDYGDYHFVSLNSLDWTPEQRGLNDWFEVLLQPRKYKGQLRSGGDKIAAGVTGAGLDAIDESKFTGQLAWMRDDLKGHRNAKMRVIVMHHDPWKDQGSGVMWGAASSGGFIKFMKFALSRVLNMGGGEGRLAVVKLMADHGVALEISGHDHSDYVGSPMPWEGGGGEVKFVNTTSTQFQTDGPAGKYPGYRRIWISDGKVESYNYMDPKWSYPWYRGTNVGGETNLGTLVTPAILSSVSPEPGRSTDVTLHIDNGLKKPLPRAYAELPMPYLSGGYYYQVTDGTFGQVYENREGSPGHLICQVYTDVAPGEKKSVRLRKSAAPDTLAPRGTLKINGGARLTSALDVKLDVSAGDRGGAGLRDMMISNSPDFKGAEWVPCRGTVAWTLLPGGAGLRAAYVRFRDMSMPGNVSETVRATILYGRTP